MAAAEVVDASLLRCGLAGMRSTLLDIRERFRTDRTPGSQAYAQESLKVTPDANRALLAADAVAAINEFLDALGA